MSETNGQGATLTKELLLAARRKRVMTSLGMEATIGGLGYSDLAMLTGALLDVSTLGEEAKKVPPEDLAKSPRGAALASGIEKVLIAGVIEPKLFTDRSQGPTPADLPLVDQMALFSAICELSGYSKAAGESVRPS